MKNNMNIVVRLAVAAVMMLGFGQAYAFHSGGVAECGGCHSMHSPMDAGGFLLIASDPSSTCLTCHAASGAGSYHVATPDADLGPGIAPYNRNPGGDFSWLKKSYTWVVRGSTNTETGASHGHNIVAADFNFVADGTGTSPGGSYAAANLSCVSCHDMHGQTRRLASGAIVKGGVSGVATAPIIGSGSYDTSFGNSATKAIPVGAAVGIYRLLWGPGSVVNNVTFSGVPAAVAPGSYNRSESTTQTRVAYGVATTGGQQTWGNWCATCHGAMHSNGNYVHPVDQALGTTIIGLYTNYVSSGDLSGAFTGNHLNQGPFLSLAPFISNTGNFVTLAGLSAGGATTAAKLAGPTDGDQVSCLSCHRAHASAFPEMLRWQMEGEFITVADTATSTIALWPGTDNGAGAQFARGRTAVEQAAGYYDRPATVFGVYNRVLCNKCHAKD